jgi:hypothetical protein
MSRSPGAHVVPSGAGSGPGNAAEIVEALKASADQEFQIAERLASKARQAYALAAGVFVVSQTVAFNNFGVAKLSGYEKHTILALAVLAVLALAIATARVLAADDVVASRDLLLEDLMADLNAAYEGDDGVLGRLGGYYAGVVRSRRDANTVRRKAYKSCRTFVALSLATTVLELVFALIVRTI